MTTNPKPRIDEFVKKYVELRDKKAELKAEYDNKVESIDKVMQAIENLMLNEFNVQGIDSVRTKAGTAYQSVKTSATVADWDTLLDYVVKHKAYELLERRVSKQAVEQFKEVHDDLPPGVNWSQTLTVNIRRS